MIIGSAWGFSTILHAMDRSEPRCEAACASCCAQVGPKCGHTDSKAVHATQFSTGHRMRCAAQGSTGRVDIPCPGIRCA